MLDALERGASDEQAIKMGLLNATFEALFEYASLDKLLTGNPKNLISALLQQGGVEASEEAATTLANNVADILVMAEKSDYQLKIQAYMESGMSKEEATKQALLDKCIELGWDAVGGFFSGAYPAASVRRCPEYIPVEKPKPRRPRKHRPRPRRKLRLRRRRKLGR